MHDLGPRIYSQTEEISSLIRPVLTIHYQQGWRRLTKIYNRDYSKRPFPSYPKPMFQRTLKAGVCARVIGSEHGSGHFL